MSRVNPRLVYWIASLYEYPELTSAHRDLLAYVATKRLDFGSGAGYCSERVVADALGVNESTVRRAFAMARKLGLMERTRRGHRLGDGRVISSEWQVIYPPIPTGQGSPVENSTAQESPVDPISTGQRKQSQPGATDPPTGIEVDTGIEEPLSQAPTDAGLLRAAVPDADEREIEQALTDLETRHAFREIRTVRGYLKTLIRNGDAHALIEEARSALARDEGPRSEACKSGSHECAYGDGDGWCTCRCHVTVRIGGA